ncbi:MAG: metallophosphoesterase [Acidobacteria bacterium]|nr:metallophosphoesterase [Acidobacteriota bacterium]
MRRWRTRVLLTTACIAAVAGACLVYAYFIEPKRLLLNAQELQIQGLDPAFDGLKIVVIGDVHGGSNGVDKAKLRLIVALANEQQPDLVVLLGDYVSQAGRADNSGKRPLKMPIEDVADGLAGLRSTLGVFAVLGNHDGAYSDERVAAALTSDGYRVLQNEVVVIERNGRPLRLLGFIDHLKLADRWSEISHDAKPWLSDKGQGQIIALEHSPDILPAITGEQSVSPDLKLILAAHTHGGQVWLPVIGTPIVPSSYGQKYSYGHIKENDVDMFVTSGVGESILPIRFMMPPEIAVLTLRAVPN